MEPFKINLSQMAETSGRYRRFLIVLALIFIVISAISFGVFHNKHDYREWLFAILGVYAIAFIYFAFAGHKAQLYLSADDFAIEYQFGFFVKTPSSIMWQTVNKVKLGPTYMAFLKRSGKGKKIHLGWLPYSKVIEIKEKIKLFSEAKGIEVEVADFHRG